MSCFSALESQIYTFFWVPQEIILLRHKVFREYAKIAVGPDFIHTLPSFLILMATFIILWKNPPSSNWLCQMLGASTIYKSLQVATSWVTINGVLWFWLILQRILYCSVWTYWNYETESQEISYQWWQQVWSSYYPTSLQPPVMSAGFISWIISMSVAIATLGCALSATRVRNFTGESLTTLNDAFRVIKCYVNGHLNRIRESVLISERNKSEDESYESSICENCGSNLSYDMNNQPRKEVYPISYGTNWTPKPNFSGYKKAQRKVSMKSLHTVAVVNDVENTEGLSPKQMRQRRGCHTVIPSNSSDKSSG